MKKPASPHTEQAGQKVVSRQGGSYSGSDGKNNRLNRHDFTTVKDRARDQWPAILTGLGIDPAVLRNRHSTCPGCGGKDRFRFDDKNGHGTFICGQGGEALSGDGFTLLTHVYHYTPTEALNAVARWLGLDNSDSQPVSAPQRRYTVSTTPPAHDKDAENRARFWMQSTWTQAFPLTEPAAEPARRYLASRGLADLVQRKDLPSMAAVRLHPALRYWTRNADDKLVSLGDFPALVSKVRTAAGLPVGLHLTYLAPDGGGKARLVDSVTGEVLPTKKLRVVAAGAGRGAAIPLYPAGVRLAIAEGIETALAVRLALPDLPVWAARDAGTLARLELPPAVRELLILADRDANGAGEKAARALAERATAAGVTVRLIVPAGELPSGCKGIDWLDVLTKESRH